jgi:ribosomal protein S18 acetylase RimI-like enzyme
VTQVRRLRADETAPLRHLRLRALREDPGAFAETYQEAAARPHEDWAAWAASTVFVATDGERCIGMVACRPRDGATWLSALWVDPVARGRGLGLSLIEAVAGWAREQGSPAVTLSVTTNNEAAAALYARAGFAETGRRRPLPADPSRTEVFLRRPVSPARRQGR